MIAMVVDTDADAVAPVDDVVADVEKVAESVGESSHKSRGWRNKVSELAYRGVRLSYILAFYQSLAEGTLQDSRGQQIFAHFDPDKHTTTDVTRQAIIPVTVVSHFGPSAFATVVQENRSTLATVMVSHHWRNLFCHTVAGMIAFALGLSTYEGIVQALKDFWQHWMEALRIQKINVYNAFEYEYLFAYTWSCRIHCC